MGQANPAALGTGAP